MYFLFKIELQEKMQRNVLYLSPQSMPPTLIPISYFITPLRFVLRSQETYAPFVLILSRIFFELKQETLTHVTALYMKYFNIWKDLKDDFNLVLPFRDAGFSFDSQVSAIVTPAKMEMNVSKLIHIYLGKSAIV